MKSEKYIAIDEKSRYGFSTSERRVKPYFKNNIFKNKVIVIIGCCKLDIFEDKFVYHDVILDNSINKLFVIDYFLQ